MRSVISNRYHALHWTTLPAGEDLDKHAAVKPYDEAWNSVALQLIDAVRSHCSLFMLVKFVETVREVQDPAVKAVLELSLIHI